MTTCYLHNEAEAVGICVGCGKFICETCNTELKGKNYCKKCLDELFEENQRKVEKLEEKANKQQPVGIYDCRWRRRVLECFLSGKQCKWSTNRS